jgi:hypothetical protein
MLQRALTKISIQLRIRVLWFWGEFNPWTTHQRNKFFRATMFTMART